MQANSAPNARARRRAGRLADQPAPGGAPGIEQPRTPAPAEVVTALYRAHAIGLIRLAVIMLGERPAAEDVVQEAFCGLYRRWTGLSDPDNALRYVRSSVLNGCRTELRNRSRAGRHAQREPLPADAASAEQAALIIEEHREVLAALRRLPSRQREALALRFFIGLPEAEIARSMAISRGTVKSTTSRALRALARMLAEEE